MLFSVQNSPLYQHLIESGVENISSEKTIWSGKDTVEKRTIHNSQQDLTGSSVFTKCTGYFSSIVSILLGINQLKSEVNQIKLFYRTCILEKSLQHKALEEEDKNYLQHFSGQRQAEHLQGRQDPALVSKIIIMFGIPLLTSYFYGRLMWPTYPWKYKQMTDAVSVLTAVYFLYLIGKALYLAWYKWSLEGSVQEVTEMLGAGEDFFRWTSKCLRLIQETELVARGFTLVSQKSSLSRIEQNGMLGYQRQCPQLRAQLFTLCRDCLIATKDWTSQLIARNPISADRTINFLAHIPLEEYGPCLQVKGDNPESQKELENVTDGFSVSAIKGVNQVCKMQYSELCRSVVLRVLQSLESHGSNPTITQGIQERYQQSAKELETLYGYYNSVTSPSETLPQKQDLSKMNDLDIAVHSLDLHLQAALLRVRKLSVLLKHSPNQDTDTTDKLTSSQPMESLLDQIKQELLASKGCWEEGLERLQKLYKYQPIPAERPDEGEKQAVHTQIHVDVPPVDLFNTSPPIIEDEVFEAYIDEEVDADPDYSWDEYLTPEEKERKKREKQEALRLLTELKSVISVRAEEMGRRERIAQERKYGPVSPETTGDRKLESSMGGEDCHRETRSTEEHYPLANRLCNSEQESVCLKNEKEFNTDKNFNGENYNRTTHEQFKSGGDNRNPESEQNPDPEKDNQSCGRLFTTGSEEDSVDCSLGNFPHSVPRDGVLPVHSPSFQFSSNLAAMAVARSREFGLTEDTFGDSESDSDQSEDQTIEG